MTTDVIPLGTSSAVPTDERHLSALAIERKGQVLLFDCGEGTQYRLREAGLSWARIDAIFVTHLHGDHCYGLPGLLSTMDLQQRTAPVTLVLPPGGAALLRAVPGVAPERLSFPVHVVEGDAALGPSAAYEADEVVVDARRLDHGEAVSMGFRVEERMRPGRFDPEQAGALGVPEGPAFGRLQRGNPVTTPDGTTVNPAQVLGPPRPGVAVAYVTDTRPCDGGRVLAEEADLLYHDATFADDHAARAHETGHSTARQAATVAREAGAGRLLLGHLSARYPDPTPLEREARSVFSAAAVAEELRRYELDPREKEPPVDSTDES
ncbi:ribonuclease Z [Salinibacter altiplanensis]|uniref:ribonuclease Z n=1 Tax=Salinibacter altiplanensis TaxID=1803181 RepID=UPI000C9ED059|nr:ribonuclease Z [Salinibacter altiplanensis]